jgi:hypothetical protein
MAAQWMVTLFAIYMLAGVAFAAAFVTVGIARVDPVATHAPWGFRLMVMPGVAALWPLLLARWVQARRGAGQ